MAISIGSNISSLGAQRRLSQASDKLSSIYERLSSGLRINQPADDAAGLAIASTLSVQSKIYTQGIRNINDGISLISIAEGAIKSLGTVVLRQKELAEQAANGTYSPSQRSALNKESFQLTQEYNRIIQSTTFNGMKIIDGSDDGVRLQHGNGVQESTYVGVSDYLGVLAGDGTFKAGVSYRASQGIIGFGIDISHGDFNGDGIEDLINNGSGGLSVLLGNGDGSFKASITSPIGTSGVSISIGDFNGDGKADVVSVDNVSNKLLVSLGVGDGTFSASFSIGTGVNPNSLSVGDFNGDGITDIVTADRGSNRLSILLGNSNGTFSLGTPLTAAGSPLDVEAKDINGDGILDLVSGDPGAGAVSVFIGKGNGTFGSSVSYAITGGLASAHAYSLVISDLNGDGIQDLISADSNLGTSILLGNSDGSFKAAVSVVIPSPNELITVDVNGDGILDMISADGNNYFNLNLGNGDGTFKARISYLTGDSPSGVTTFDTNGDGIIDIVSDDQNQGTFSVFIGNADSAARHNNLAAAFDLTTLRGARDALTRTTTLLDRISNQLGNIGATQSRLTISANSLTVRAENYIAARSRIMDSDVAEDSAQLVATNIIQQAAAAILAQANQAPALALQLLK